MAADRENYAAPTATGRVVEVWSLILRHLLLITFMSGVGVGLGYFYFLRTPPSFQSSARMLIRNESNNQAIPFQGMESNYQTKKEEPHALLIASPVVVEKALKTPFFALAGSKKTEAAARLMKLAETGEKVDSSDEPEYDTKRALKDLPCFEGVSNQTGYIISRLTARPAMQNGVESRDVFNLDYRDSDPLNTKIVLDTLVVAYDDWLGDSHSQGGGEVLNLIQNAQNTLKKDLTRLEKDYADFRQTTPSLYQGDFKAINVHKDRMTEIEIARSKLRILLTERRAELQSLNDALTRGGSREAIALMLQSLKPDPRLTDAGVKTPASQLFQLMLDEQLLLLELGPEHPKVNAKRKMIEMTREHLAKDTSDDDQGIRPPRGDFVTVTMDSIRHEISSIDAKILELDKLFENERYAARSVEDYEIQSDVFRKDIERTEQLYQGVVKRLDELNLLQNYGGYKTNVISPARPGIHVAPVFLQCLLIGAFCGAAVGFAISYLAEANDKTFRSPEEVSEHLDLPIVGHIPVIERESAGVSGDSSLDKMLVTYFKPKSRLAESYRAIRTSLYFSTRGEQHKVIQITSPNPGDGKTTLSANLAVSIAQSGKRVLLIDADFRRPRIHDLFGLDKSVGMSSVISGEAELPDAIQSTEVENLWGLPCGPRPNNPCELLTSRRFEELLEILREQYDFVIIDTPPLLAVTDPSAVAARVDGVILTIRLSKRTRGEAAKATELLASMGGNTLGVVVNGIGKTTGYGYGYGGYQYQYNGRYSYEKGGENPYYADSDEKSPSDDRAKRRSRVGRSTT